MYILRLRVALFLALLSYIGSASDHSVSEGSGLHVSFTGYHYHAYVSRAQSVARRQGETMRLSFFDAPNYGAMSRKNDISLESIFSDDDIETIRSIPRREKDDPVDVELRFTYPHDIRPPVWPHTILFVFVTAEFYVHKPIQNLIMTEKPWFIIMPSFWSARIMTDFGGVPLSKIFLLPHGYDKRVIYPIPLRSLGCQSLREELGVPMEGILLLNVGAGTQNKNVELLIEVFAKLSEDYPSSALVVKTMTDLYSSAMNIQDAVMQSRSMTSSVLWLDGIYPDEIMGTIYRCADVYVSPYMAEGFNIPVLESLASGVPVVVSRGGPTDEFVSSESGLFVDTTILQYLDDGMPVRYLQVNETSLKETLKFVMDDFYYGNKAWLSKARKAAAPSVVTYEWTEIAGKLQGFIDVGLDIV